MRRMVSALLFFVVLGSGLTLSARVASADDVGLLGTVVGLQVNTTSADTYLTFHGRVWVKNTNNVVEEYRWGGSTCGIRVLSEEQVERLHLALNNRNMRIEPLYQLGQADLLCVVGFSLVPKQNLKLGIP